MRLRPATLAPAVGEESSRYAQRPRAVRFRPRGWLYSAGVVAAMAALILLFRVLLADSSARQSGRGLFALAIFGWYGWLCVSFFRNRWMEYRLIADGECANGIVLEQREMARSMPRITYKFRDALQRDSEYRVTDFSRRIYEDMPVTVFYDERDPSRSTALESSLFRIAR